ncbi:cilia- and flagella-associated protein 70-like isoform X3 [Convolutriloba macropyga]|uniref:cilia- and flagella-associated protein 70-like isoform X3 n=1 Tax=Convolutriloba macropyga TaxID=536237 RepID=UPI003F5232B7
MTDLTAPGKELETLTVYVNGGHNLRGSRGETLTAAVKVEFNGLVLGESARVECVENEPVDFDFSAPYSCNFEDPTMLDELAHKPIIVTLIEILPKEKKQREEKTNVLGQASVDVMPLLSDNVTSNRQTIQVHAVPGSAIDNLSPEIPKLELDITLNVTQPLVADIEANVMAITVESMYSPPDSWNPTHTQYNYSITAPIPFAGLGALPDDVKDNNVSFPIGVLKTAHDKEPLPGAKKWLNPGPTTQGNAIYIPDKLIPEAASNAEDFEQEDGELKEKTDGEWRLEAEASKNRVVWNTERRCFLQPIAVSKVQTQIATSRFWPFEIWRTQQSKEPKTKKGNLMSREDEAQQSFHGIAYVNMAKLLYPGIKKIRGAFKVHPYNEAEYFEKTKRATRVEARPGSGRQSPGQAGAAEGGKRDPGGTAVKGEKPATGSNKDANNPPSTQEKQKKEGTKSKQRADKQSNERLAAAGPASDRTSGAQLGMHHSMQQQASQGGKDEDDGVDHEAQQYQEAGSYVVVEIELIRPLVPKKDPNFLVQSVAQYIPPRPRFPLRTNGADKAVDDFHSQVVNVVNLILEQYRDLFAEEISNGSREQSAEGMKQRYQTLIYELNTSGKYFAFREQLKYSVIKIVREKYLRTTNFESQAELQKFLSELYVFLIDEMHKGLAKVLTLEDQTPVPEPLTDADQLKHFAREAEMNNNMKLADQFYLERISRNRKDPLYWFDYACFNLLSGDITKSVECTKECVAIDQKNLKGLLLYGILMLVDEKFDQAEIFLEAATNFYPDCVEAWTVLGLYYDSIGNDIGHEMAIEQAVRVNLQLTAEEHKRQLEIERAEQQAKRELAEAEAAAHAKEAATTAAALTTSDTPQGDLLTLDDTVLAAGDPNQSTGEVQKPGSGVAGGDDLNASGLNRSSSSAMNNAPGNTSTGSATAAKRSNLNSAAKATAASPNPPAGGGKDTAKKKGKDASRNQTPAVGKGDPNSGFTGEDGGEEGAERSSEPPLPEQSIYMITAQFLLDINALKLADRALSHELTSVSQGGGGATLLYHLSLARLNLQLGNLVQAEKSARQAISIDFKSGDAWSLDGHVHFLRGEKEEARVSYERVLSFSPPSPQMHAIYLRLASIYLAEGRFEDAKCTYLLACRDSPSCTAWHGVGVACYRLGALPEAEDALCEANILNNRDPEVWAYLTLVCLQTGRAFEAEQSYKYALKVGLENDQLLREIRDLQKTVGFGDPSF